jgi:type IV secretory pathway protease TraF
MLAIVMVAALAAAGPLVASAVPVGLAVKVAVPVSRSSVVLLDPPQAAANAATRHRAAQNKPNLFMVTPLD